VGKNIGETNHFHSSRAKEMELMRKGFKRRERHSKPGRSKKVVKLGGFVAVTGRGVGTQTFTGKDQWLIVGAPRKSVGEHVILVGGLDCNRGPRVMKKNT